MTTTKSVRGPSQTSTIIPTRARIRCNRTTPYMGAREETATRHLPQKEMFLARLTRAPICTLHYYTDRRLSPSPYSADAARGRIDRGAIYFPVRRTYMYTSARAGVIETPSARELFFTGCPRILLRARARTSIPRRSACAPVSLVANT